MIVRVFRFLGCDRASRVGGALSRWIGPWLPVHRVGDVNLRKIFPNLSADERMDILKRMWAHWGSVCAEYCHLDTLAGRTVQVEGKAVLHTLQNKPCIFVSGHYGNFQIITMVLKQLGFKVTQVYRQANNPWVDRVMQQFQGQVCNKVVSKSQHSVKAMVDTLQAGECVFILVDQKFAQGPLIPFLKHMAHTTMIPARFAQKYGCPLIPVCAERLRGAEFKVHFYDPVDTEGAAQEVMERVNHCLESWIHRNPEQWFWIHRRWPFKY